MSKTYIRANPNPLTIAVEGSAVQDAVKGDDMGTRQASLGGDNRFTNGRNFLATDKVPDTIFGIPVAKAEGEWTEEDLKFFKEHPEAGGYYSMGDEGTPEDGTEEGAPVQADMPVEFLSYSDVDAPGNSDEVVNRILGAMKNAASFTKTHEGFRSGFYLDSKGVPSIGYGQTEFRGRKPRRGDVISEEEASKWLGKRTKENAAYAYKNYKWSRSLSQGAWSALLDLMYNSGTRRLDRVNSPNFNKRIDKGENPETVLWDEYTSYSGVPRPKTEKDHKTNEAIFGRRTDAIQKFMPLLRKAEDASETAPRTTEVA